MDNKVDRHTVNQIIQSHKDELSELGVRSLALFGSTVRNQSSADSDIDFLVEFDRPIGLLHFSKVRLRLEQIIGIPVDLVSRKALIDELKEDILAEAVDVL
ncbi:nucleotidyltransferase family protein [bacterium]|nr:nucleotidyltransferase family protein [bacterium]